MLRRVLICTLLIPLASACSGQSTTSPPPIREEKKVLPSRNDLWISEGRTFTASELEALREKYPSVSPADLLRLSQWMLLFEDLQSTGALSETSKLLEFVEDLRPLLPPRPDGLNAEVYEKKVKSLYGHKNAASWRDDLDRRVKLRTFSWNLPLLKEYGIAAP